MTMKTLISLILIGLVMIFTFQNMEEVRVYFLTWEVAMPRALMILVIFLIGASVGWLGRGMKRRR